MSTAAFACGPVLEGAVSGVAALGETGGGAGAGAVVWAAGTAGTGVGVTTGGGNITTGADIGAT